MTNSMSAILNRSKSA